MNDFEQQPTSMQDAWLVRHVEQSDAVAWARLYEGYRNFYNLPEDPEVVRTTWSWVVNQEHGMHGLVAAGQDGTIGAIANLRTFARPSSGRLGLYLDDLYTAPDHRGIGLGGMLLERSAKLAGDLGANVVRWITAEDNTSARSLYDAKAQATRWVTYDMVPK